MHEQSCIDLHNACNAIIQQVISYTTKWNSFLKYHWFYWKYQNVFYKTIWPTFYGKSNMLFRTFGSCSYAVKLLLFMSYCGSMYTVFLVCDFTKRQYRQLEVAYKNVFQRYLKYDRYCSASSMFVENRTDGFDVRVCKLVYGFKERLQISENSLFHLLWCLLCTYTILCMFFLTVNHKRNAGIVLA